jgi:transposase
MLAPSSRLASARCLEATSSSAPRRASGRRSNRLESSESRRCKHCGEKRGEIIGPNPTDRGKPGSKRHLVVDRRGIPLAVMLSGANEHDSLFLEPLIDAIEPIRGRRGRPRQRPDKLHADKAYDADRCRRSLRLRGIVPRIARKGVESKSSLGRYRWVVERTFAWLARYRRLSIRYEKRADIHEAFLVLGCALICFNFLRF